MSQLSQSTQPFFSTPLANKVVFPKKEQHQREEGKVDAVWLTQLSSQTNYCLGLPVMAHVQTGESKGTHSPCTRHGRCSSRVDVLWVSQNMYKHSSSPV